MLPRVRGTISQPNPPRLRAQRPVYYLKLCGSYTASLAVGLNRTGIPEVLKLTEDHVVFFFQDPFPRVEVADLPKGEG